MVFQVGFHLGLLRDMPINKKRNIAIGIRFGIILQIHIIKIY